MATFVAKSNLERVTKTQTVLAVDDTVANLKAIYGILNGGNLAVSIAASGSDALNILSRTVIDIALLDIEMPGMSGLELYEEMLKDPVMKTIPVIFVTADRMGSVVKRAVDMGAAGYVIKPYDAAALVQKVQSTLDKAEVDQGAVYLDTKFRELLSAVKSYNPRALDILSQIPVKIFVPAIALILNRVKLQVTQQEFDGAANLLKNVIGKDYQEENFVIKE